MDDRVDYSVPTWDRTDSVSRALVRLIAQSTNDGIWDQNLKLTKSTILRAGSN